MSVRIDPQIQSQLNTTHLETPSGAPQFQPVGEQIQQTLFSRVQPRLLSVHDFPELAWLLVVLNKYRRKLAQMVGDRDEDYAIVLADDTIAAVDQHGTIFMGVAFLKGHKDNLDVLVGALAHEIGHRPKRVRQLNVNLSRDLTRPELQALCLHEEIRADTFAGKALAELGFSCEPLIDFLRLVQVRPHPEYLPAEQRGEVIRDAHAGRAYRAEARRKLFPEYHRHTSPNGHLGDY
ncbi:MAG TPA: hypothetical protein VFH51_20355 [Myxococcota bacterium]|nr:hypothetical protein [Myxococcota bacterium]